MIIKKILVLTFFYIFTNSIFAHGGGVDSNGCHVQKIQEKNIATVKRKTLEMQN